MPTLSLEYRAINNMADGARQKDNERINQPLNQRQGYHVTIGDMRDFVREHRLHFVLSHGLQEPRADCYQRVISPHSGSEGVHVQRIVGGDLRRANTRPSRLAFHSFE